jgi:hypothetical protein
LEYGVALQSIDTGMPFIVTVLLDESWKKLKIAIEQHDSYMDVVWRYVVHWYRVLRQRDGNRLVDACGMYHVLPYHYDHKHKAEHDSAE